MMRRPYARVMAVLPRWASRPLNERIHALLHPRIGVRPAPKVIGECVLEPFLHGAKAAVCFSADFELLWAWRFGTPSPDWQAGQKTRDYFPRLLDTFDEFGVPVTWATVGHLFLNSCQRDPQTGLAHPEMRRPAAHYRNRYWEFSHGDWYQHDPCTSVAEDGDWYAPDLIRRILESLNRHEIGSHSFSHVDFAEEHCSPELAESELARCQQEAAELGLRLRSFVFPGNFHGNLEALRDCDFVTFRGDDGIDLAYPERAKEGLWNIRGSLFLFARDVDYLRRIQRYLKRAMQSSTVFHLGFHPSDADSNAIEEALRPALLMLKQAEDRGDLWIGTMEEIASYCEARERLRVDKVSSNPEEYSLTWDLDLNRFPKAALTLSFPPHRTRTVCLVDGREAERKDFLVRNQRVLLTVRPPTSRIVLQYD